jgi:hypothetical protein
LPSPSGFASDLKPSLAFEHVKSLMAIARAFTTLIAVYSR